MASLKGQGQTDTVKDCLGQYIGFLLKYTLFNTLLKYTLFDILGFAQWVRRLDCKY